MIQASTCTSLITIKLNGKQYTYITYRGNMTLTSDEQLFKEKYCIKIRRKIFKEKYCNKIRRKII